MYQDTARSLLTLSFLHLSTAATSTLLAIPKNPSTEQFMEALKLYPSCNFNTQIQIEKENQGIREMLSIGWALTSNDMTVFTDDLLNHLQDQVMIDQSNNVRRNQVLPYLLNLVQVYIEEMVGAIYKIYTGRPADVVFVDQIYPHLQLLFEHLLSKLGATNPSYRSIAETFSTVDRERVRGTIALMQGNQPSFPEFYVCPTNMDLYFNRDHEKVFTTRINWDASVLKTRCISLCPTFFQTRTARIEVDLIPLWSREIPFRLVDAHNPAEDLSDLMLYDSPVQIFRPPNNAELANPSAENENQYVPGWIATSAYIPSQFFEPHADFLKPFYEAENENFNDDRADSDLEYEVFDGVRGFRRR